METIANDRLVYEPLVERDGTQVSRSPWGADDQIGRLNWITPESQKAILDRLDGVKVLDLSVDYFIGMPSWSAAGDPKFDIWMTHTPQGSVVDDLSGAGRAAHEKHSYCGDSVAFYTHCGTHIDTLNHMGYFGCFWNGWTPEQHLGSRHWTVGGPEHYPPIIARGVLLDIAGLHGVGCLPDGHGITEDDIRAAERRQGLEVRRGDVVLLRTGRMTRWPDPDAYLLNSPGLTVAGARYLCEHGGAMVVGTDAIGMDCYPAQEPDAYLPVHSYMFATAGALIMEVVWMEELAAEQLYEFAFIGGALRLTGATGSPMRPIAVPLRG